MKISCLFVGWFFCVATLSGCVEHKAGTNPVPQAEISRAVWSDEGPSAVDISGLYFKNPSTAKEDVMATINLRNWKPARKILDSSGKHYVAVIPYDHNFQQVWVRVYGLSEDYSEPFFVGHGRP